jgi:hypothetical protein
MLAAFKRRSDLNIRRKHRIGWRKYGTKQQRSRKRHSRDHPRHSHGNNSERHRDKKQTNGRPPGLPNAQFVDANTHAEQTDDYAKFAHHFPDFGRSDRVQRRWHARNKCKCKIACRYQQGRRRWLASRYPARQPVRKQYREPDKCNNDMETGKFVKRHALNIRFLHACAGRWTPPGRHAALGSGLQSG